MEIYIMRHGNVDRDFDTIMKTGEAGDPILNPEGRKAVERTTPRILREIRPQVLHFSPAKRARETAKIIFENMISSPSRSISLPELRAVGLPTGDNLRNLLKLYIAGRVHWQKEWLKEKTPGFEPPKDYLIRTERGLEIIKMTTRPITLVVAHEETVWAYRHLIEGVPFEKAIKEKIDYCQIVKFEI